MLEPDKGQESRGVRRAMKDKQDRAPSLSFHQIIDFAPVPAQPVL